MALPGSPRSVTQYGFYPDYVGHPCRGAVYHLPEGAMNPVRRPPGRREPYRGLAADRTQTS